jgi:hypothetical protein
MGYKNDDPCIKKAFYDEMLFVLMTRDATAPKTVVEWIKMNIGVQPKEKLHEALDAAIEMHERCMEMNVRKNAEIANEAIKRSLDGKSGPEYISQKFKP